ncbi:TPA: hypothetical protein N0F65_005386 [Lagenidium giganteum]|uniref:Uncharacterized protein n=1 Tax=Lagenidium giganteum TaxID=4803 RepID=A0AAV2Z1M7_9STRA|nr:TPA: hypothetical protein N0F65_005386 [Lagenidium giganteum]
MSATPLPTSQYELRDNTIQTTPKPNCRRWIKPLAATFAFVGCAAAVAVGIYSAHSPAFQHDTKNFLDDVAEGKALQVTFKQRQDSASAPSGLPVQGLFFPREDAAGKLAFDGRISYVHVNQRYNFTLIDDRGYVTIEDAETGKVVRNDCLKKDSVPPIQSLTSALVNGRVIDQVGASATIDIDCINGTLVEFVFANEPYIFCSKAGAAIDTVYGQDIEASLALLEAGSEGVPSRDSLVRPGAESINECKSLVDGTNAEAPSAKTAFKAFAQRSRDAVNVLAGNPRVSLMASTSCNCGGGKKACLFVHGLGQTYDGPEQSTFSEYFGDIHKRAACCSSIKFMRMDTTNNAWYDDALPKKMCKAALSMVSSSDKMKMQGIALISHSMGNLIVAAAANKGLCAIDTAKSKWISLAGPIMGSMSATTAMSMCRPPDSFRDAIREVLYSKFAVLTALGFCPAKASLKSLAFKGSSGSNAKLDSLYDRAMQYYADTVSSNICGVSPTGLVSTSSAKYIALAAFSGHASGDNDGAVHFDSCRALLPRSKYQTSWSSGNFYRASLNHADMTFRNSDGWWGDGRKPTKWFNCQF